MQVGSFTRSAHRLDICYCCRLLLFAFFFLNRTTNQGWSSTVQWPSYLMPRCKINAMVVIFRFFLCCLLFPLPEHHHRNHSCFNEDFPSSAASLRPLKTSVHLDHSLEKKKTKKKISTNTQPRLNKKNLALADSHRREIKVMGPYDHKPENVDWSKSFSCGQRNGL